MGGLVRYLAGAGRHEEHDRPHAIAAGAGIDVRLGGELDDRELRDLVAQLDAPKAIYDTDVKGGHVYHVMLSNGAGDRQLTDEQWADAARSMIEGLGIEEEGRAAAPWVAWRHGLSAAGNDHVHLAVSLVREDGTRVNTHYDFRRAGAVCAQLEERLSLVRVDGRHGPTPMPAFGRAELEIAAREERPEPVRQGIARQVRAAADASRDEAEFVRRLRGEGLAVRPRHAAGDRTRIVGYAVRTGETDARWWAGGKLAPDLSLPSLRARWPERVDDQAAAWAKPEADRTPGREAQRLDPSTWQEAVQRTQELVGDVGRRVDAGELTWNDVALDGAGVAAALAQRLERVRPGPLAAAADTMARSAERDLRSATRARPLSGIATVVLQGSGDNTGRALLLMIIEVARLADTLQRVHAAQAQLSRARELQRHVGELRHALDDSRQGGGPWNLSHSLPPAAQTVQTVQTDRTLALPPQRPFPTRDPDLER